MKNYDDLQRFKEKTRTGAINFKDMSAQTQTADSGRWAIIKQLNQVPGEENALSHAGSVSVPVPQSVAADAFDISLAKPAPTSPQIPAAGQASILNSVASAVSSAQVQPAPQPVPEAPVIKPQPAAPSLFDQLTPAPVTGPQATAVPPAARQQAEAIPFNKLFAAKTAPAATQAGKDLPLQPLLEMIASCR
ncbi:cellulose biosynthesis protein BcsO [Cedecea davisae]|uniref:Cellulose biosynthesis protein BcsO n=1 Tax=Cedecea davisae TaxID=158484 RepID=A0ABS6DG68_9ENTR|nr:cellulose biosynthesis protein BcsO [Cedecea davisae]MBU4682194.1 cellulose biosynthesis protein BcsO [Cedecea davisae]MBU4687227.1 cellulose biosynthesis protein BcsO [Cedecea davisae]